MRQPNGLCDQQLNLRPPNPTVPFCSVTPTIGTDSHKATLASVTKITIFSN